MTGSHLTASTDFSARISDGTELLAPVLTEPECSRTINPIQPFIFHDDLPCFVFSATVEACHGGEGQVFGVLTPERVAL